MHFSHSHQNFSTARSRLSASKAFARLLATDANRTVEWIRDFLRIHQKGRINMAEQLKTLLVDELQDLINAETQLVKALPLMAKAAHEPKLREAFEKHLAQTQQHVDRLNTAFDLLDAQPQSKSCKSMTGIISEGRQRIEELQNEPELAADLGLIAAAQKAEHYEISAYGTVHCLARQIGERQIAKLLSQTLGEEQAADYLLTEISKPILQKATSESAKPARARAQKA
jgi:ferritin-like metal-binding protein YciE